MTDFEVNESGTRKTLDEKDLEIVKLRLALSDARDAVRSLPVDALGEACDGMMRWPIRDELVDKMTKALDG